jgi:hypothetical protein
MDSPSCSRISANQNHHPIQPRPAMRKVYQKAESDALERFSGHFLGNVAIAKLINYYFS